MMHNNAGTSRHPFIDKRTFALGSALFVAGFGVFAGGVYLVSEATHEPLPMASAPALSSASALPGTPASAFPPGLIGGHASSSATPGALRLVALPRPPNVVGRAMPSVVNRSAPLRSTGRLAAGVVTPAGLSAAAVTRSPVAAGHGAAMAPGAIAAASSAAVVMPGLPSAAGSSTAAMPRVAASTGAMPSVASPSRQVAGPSVAVPSKRVELRSAGRSSSFGATSATVAAGTGAGALPIVLLKRNAAHSESAASQSADCYGRPAGSGRGASSAASAARAPKARPTVMPLLVGTTPGSVLLQTSNRLDPHANAAHSLLIFQNSRTTQAPLAEVAPKN